MDTFTDLCAHRSIPVETDESMTSFVPDFNWPPSCERCLDLRPDHEDVKGAKLLATEIKVNGAFPATCWLTPPPQYPQILQQPPFQRAPAPHNLPRGDQGGARGFWNVPNWPRKPSLDEIVDFPQPLRSDLTDGGLHVLPHHVQAQYANPPRDRDPREYTCQAPTPLTNHKQQPTRNFVNTPQCADPSREVMTEVSVVQSCGLYPGHPAGGHPAGGHTPMQEMKKTISLPDECRNVFITYSSDSAKDIVPFVKFLMCQGFKPAIDIFETAIRQMDINKWMDSYLKDKSVLIIVVISPKYKSDIEGEGLDELGLHTKYIHNQLQNEFIQQRCLNFRIVPVLFPNALKKHAPYWLLGTQIYRWPQDTQSLLLRLLREERYVVPPLGKELTLSIRPI